MRQYLITSLYYTFLLCSFVILAEGETTPKDEKNIKFASSYNITANTRFLIYDVKNGEGFSLRQQVYVRVANLMKYMIDRGEDWVLVLPPWRHMHHWGSHFINQEGIPWRNFFDIESMNKYVPVMEFEDYMKLDNGIDHLLYLQWHPGGFSPTQGLVNVIEINECRQPTYYKRDNDGLYRGYFWNMKNVYARKHDCVSVGGYADVLADFLKQLPSKSFLILQFEQVGATGFGSVEYFKPRRSLVFAKHLRAEGDSFRLNYLNSTDLNDKTLYNEDWRKQIPEQGSAVGGPFIGIHMRRGDFVFAHISIVPTIEEIGKEIKKKLNEYKLNHVYVSTDASDNEVQELQKHFNAQIHRYPRTRDIIEKYKDGGVAIIDRWIVSHARYFIGSCFSTYSFRIQEERDILGFDHDTTYNCICGKQSPPDECDQPSRWTVQF